MTESLTSAVFTGDISLDGHFGSRMTTVAYIDNIMYMSGFAMLITNAYTVQSNVDIKFSANDACLERLESQMIYSLGSNKGLNRMAKIC